MIMTHCEIYSFDDSTDDDCISFSFAAASQPCAAKKKSSLKIFFWREEEKYSRPP